MGFLSRFFYSEVIEIIDGRAVSMKGRHPQRLLSDIEDVCREFEISAGTIGFSGNGTLKFSGDIPPATHQALRNVIVNHL